MPNDATNHKKYLMTVANDKEQQMARGKALPYHEHENAGKTTADNHIETYKTIREERCQRTFISNNYLIHDESHIGHNYGAWPSWYASNAEKLGAPPVGNGITGHQVQYFAIAADHSPDVKVEGHWAVREFDKTHQDNSNGPGEFIYNSHDAEVPDDSDLLFMQCSVDKLKLACSHDRETMEGELHVYLGEKVTVTAYRVNAAETDPVKRMKIHCDFPLYKEKRKPPAEETRHAALLLSRNSHVILPGVVQGWDKKENITMVGENKQLNDPETKLLVNITTFTLDEEWLLKIDKEQKTQKGKDTGNEVNAEDAEKAATKSALAQRAAQRDLGDKNYEASRNNSPAAANAAVAASAKKDAAIEKHSQDVSNVRSNELRAQARVAGKLVVQSYQAFVGLILFSPLEIKLAAHGCSKGPSGTIKAYVPGEFSVDLWTLTDFPLKNRLVQIKTLVDDALSFLKMIKGSSVVGDTLNHDVSIGTGTFTIYLTLLKGWVKGGENKDKNAAPTVTEPKIAVTGEWKELERDSEGEHETKGLKKWMIKRKLSLDVGFERLIGLKFVAKVSLLDMSFLVFVEEVLHYLGVDSGPFIEFDIDLGMGVAGKFAWDEYGRFEAEEAGVELSAQLDIQLYIQLGNAFKAGVKVEGKWTPKYKLCKDKNDQAVIKAEPSSIHIKGLAFVDYDVTIWSGESSYELFDWPIYVAATEHPVIEQSHH